MFGSFCFPVQSVKQSLENFGAGLEANCVFLAGPLTIGIVNISFRAQTKDLREDGQKQPPEVLRNF